VGLVDFIEDLTIQGIANVSGRMGDCQEDDGGKALALLKGCYDHTIYEVPDGLPPFDGEAAVWATRYLYKAVQLVMLRQLGEEVVREQLTDYPGERSPAAVYSVDLSFRHLPSLLGLAKGLAPDDILVKKLQDQAYQWPFSSVGTDIRPGVELSVVVGDPCLRQIYIDRVIEARDLQRAQDERVLPFVAASLGDHATTLWPGFKTPEKDLHGKGPADRRPDKYYPPAS